jgi:hypothetical protein
MKDDTSFQVGFKLPASLSAWTGFLFTLAGGFFCWLFHWPFLWALAAGGAVTFVVWMNLYNRMLYLIEFVLKADINGDGVIGAPLTQLPPPTTRIELIKTDQDHNLVEGDYINLPAEPEQLAQLADGLSQGYSLSINKWTGRGKPFTRSQFETLLDVFHTRGLAAPLSAKSPNSGYALTVAGKHVISRFARPTTPPPQNRMCIPK